MKRPHTIRGMFWFGQMKRHWHSMFVDHLLPMAMWRFGQMKFIFVYNNYNSCAQKIHKDLFHTNTSNSSIERLGTISISSFIYFLKTWVIWVWNQLQRPQINVVNPIEIDWPQTCEGLSLNLDSWEICLCAWSQNGHGELWCPILPFNSSSRDAEKHL